MKLLDIFRQSEKRNFGLIRDKKDDRDLVYKIKAPGTIYPKSTERRNIALFPYRYDQGNIGSCVGHGTAEVFRLVLGVNNMPDFEPSRLFAYFIARRDKDNDTGASIRDAFKALNKFGLCSEISWPYMESKFNILPDEPIFKEAENHQIVRYESLPQTKEAIMDALSRGYPIVYGKKLFSSFMTDRVARTGIIPMPRRCEKEIGGHCMLITDYDEAGTVELNSWSINWGQRGVCQVPWEYVLDNRKAFDFWTLYLTE
jgi:C1A family cysteine protease